MRGKGFRTKLYELLKNTQQNQNILPYKGNIGALVFVFFVGS